MEQYKRINEIWKWSNKLKGFIDTSTWDAIKDKLLKECYATKTTSSNFLGERYIFPSNITRKIAEKEIRFSRKKFTLLELLNHIHENMGLLQKNNIVNIVLMLHDIALYKAYNIIKDASYSGLYSQLNMCIILDTIKIKPDNSINAANMLKEVSDKSRMNMNMLDLSTIWAIAMLNYKMHVYNTAILFFERFLKVAEKDNSDIMRKKKIHAQIYIGYCNEKTNSQEGFLKAIDEFEELLKKLDNVCGMENIVTELHHGLGHFYNEKAIFGKSEIDDEDIMKARMHMRKALEQKPDYYSCYGSLFHEYGDYENAELIFKEAMREKTISESDELTREMQFYKGQTGSALMNGYDEQIKIAEKNFDEFEEYCKSTFNYDGIVHARIFKIRTKLRNFDFVRSNDSNRRRKNRELINKWYKELKKYTLSNYASKAIKDEYQKTIYILDIFRVLYADDTFMWHMEDILYYLKSFIKLMPDDVGMLDYSENEKNITDGHPVNLYRMCIDKLWVWCVGGQALESIINGVELRNSLNENGIDKVKVFPVKDRESAHNCIQGNGKPDMVVILPPSEKDLSFEKEIGIIIDAVSESYFLFSQETSVIYDVNWLNNITRGIRQRKYFDDISNILSYAYCFRALEILRKELLEPIPLFSLAPTHFSSSYDFQLGENVEIQLGKFNSPKNDEGQKKLRQLLQFVDSKYSSNLLGRQLVKNATDALSELCCKDEGFFSACFPQPGKKTEADKDNNYISYFINDSSALKDITLMHEVTDGEIFSIKALPSYRNIFWDIEAIINGYAKECELNDGCVTYYETLLTDDSDISRCCRKLLEVIFGKEPVDLEVPYKCILRTLKGIENGKGKDYIYMVLGASEKDDSISRPRKEKNMKPTTVFVTYAWEPEGDGFEKYQKEVYSFVSKLRNNGYDATFDLSEKESNWTQVMVDGLQKDKIIVLLTPEYKRKADGAANTGVAIERNALVERQKTNPNSVIFAKLQSQKNKSHKEITPIIFGGVKVIDLSKTNTTNGYNELYSRLDNNDRNDTGGVAPLPPVSANKPKIKTLAD